MYPGEYLNIIIGPNGTGKSTMVAAIVLGLGGTPKLLSRSLSIGEYVKNGKEEAIIEIQIYVNEEHEVIKFGRQFDTDGGNQFYLNDREISHRKLLKEVEVFHIQIDNLCQFLPQDRVQVSIYISW